MKKLDPQPVVDAWIKQLMSLSDLKVAGPLLVVNRDGDKPAVAVNFNMSLLRMFKEVGVPLLMKE